MIQIIPALLAKSEKEYKAQFDKVIKCEALKDSWVQIDLMDGEFVDSKSIDANVLKKFPTNLKKEVHLLVKNPTSWLDHLAGFKVERSIAPVEVGEAALEEFFLKCLKSNITSGLSINPQTPVASLDKFITKIEYVLVMSVNPGYQGQKFIPESVEKIRKIRKKYPFKYVGVDGGIKPSNIKSLINAGASYAIVGSGLLEGDIDENLEKFWEIIPK